MTRARPLTLLAAALLAGAFVYSSARLLLRRSPEIVDPSIEVIRFAHWQIEPGVREAFAVAPIDSWHLGNITYDARWGADNFDFLLEGVPTLVANAGRYSVEESGPVRKRGLKLKFT